MDTNTPASSVDATAAPNADAPATPPTGNKLLLEWTAMITPHHERSPRWYLIGSLLVLAFAAYGILTGAWTMSLLAILLGGLYFLIRREPPMYKRIAIHENGYEYEGVFTYWADCQEFWLIHCPGYTQLHIRKKRGFERETVIQTGSIDPNEIRSLLSQYVHLTSDRNESLLDIIIRLCKL